MQDLPTLDEIHEATNRIRPQIHRTPVLTCGTINKIIGAEIYFKCENFQKTGAFKFRGATNAVFSVSEKGASRGAATHSSGNHGAALALAARSCGVRAYVVMPENAPQVKKDAVAGYGAEVFLCAPTLRARGHTCGIDQRNGATSIHPYNDFRIIVGQATVALEFLTDIPNLDIIVTPIRGGGLTSGTVLSARFISPHTKVFTGNPQGADDAYRSFRSGRLVPSENPRTIADGLLTSLGDKTFQIVKNFVDDMITVSEGSIIAAMRCIWERMQIIVEPSAAVPLGAFLNRRRDVSSKRVGVILPGGNVDLDRIPWLAGDKANSHNKR